MTAITEQADGFKRSTKHPVWSPQQRLWRLLPGCGNWVPSTSKAYSRLKTGNIKPDARPSEYKSRAHCPPSSPQSPFWESQVHLGCQNSTLCAQQNTETLNPHADGGSSEVLMVTTGPGAHWDRGHKSTIQAAIIPSESSMFKKLPLLCRECYNLLCVLFTHIGYIITCIIHFFCQVEYTILWIWYLMNHVRNSQGWFGLCGFQMIPDSRSNPAVIKTPTPWTGSLLLWWPRTILIFLI